MMRTWCRAVLPALAAVAMAPASISAPNQEEAPAPVEEPQDPAARLEALIARFKQAQKDFFEAHSAAVTDEERRAAIDGMPKPGDYIEEFLAIAEVASGDTAAKAWAWVARFGAQSGRDELLRRAFEVLLRDGLGSEDALDLPGLIRQCAPRLEAGESERMLREVAERAPGAAMRAAALFELADLLAEGAERGSERQKEAHAILERVRIELADVADRSGRRYGDLAEAALFELDHLQVGMAVPEIEAADLDGVPFKLSDYRGKVVLLDFWGNW